jgi:hypothetical protein
VVNCYGSRSYAETLGHIGRVRWLPQAGGALFERNVSGTIYTDLVGPYPWAGFDDWSKLGDDLSRMHSGTAPVSVTAVVAPSTASTDAALQRAFPDHLVDFKPHFLVDLSSNYGDSFAASHRRKISRRDERLSICCVEPTGSVRSDWVRLYRALADRHQLSEMASFSASALTRQLYLDGTHVFAARLEQETVGMAIFMVDGPLAAYHLGAYSRRGYELEASFSLFPVAFKSLAANGVKLLNLGGGSGLGPSVNDGLSRFKRGWSTHQEMSRIGGRIIRPDVYAQLSGASPPSNYFPRYRSS